MADSTITHYNRKAANYEQKWHKYLEHTHQSLIKHIVIESSDVILDISGGTGLLAKNLVDQNYSFTYFVINDPSEEMLSIARQRFSDKPIISFKNQKVQDLSYPQNYFTKIICLNSFHFYEKQDQVLNRFYKLLKPGGKLYILDWNREGFFRILNTLIRWSSPEYINTRSLGKLRQMLSNNNFDIQKSNNWISDTGNLCL
ncbi:class I SAM-dependent methyltransferase [Fodinibius sp.]|uniref:class I SAM-dependent methyltransferase n=1 Tax=Fodinibius sp. TaxID=1872440 RepID=UPI002ACEA61A|nr:class I SAM-dependent methyltransferase [Fodinibius sp.]MDZ7659738.1 class I SAM-dependent methyltransferase [Fodinibius sp.]